MATVATLLDAEGVRLVTVTGLGGIGKTRLAREVALRLQSDFADGACFIPFAPVRDAGHIGPAIVRALGLQPSGSRSLDELVFDALHDRHVLLLLDNLEHIVEAIAPWVTSLLESCRRLSVLATSRLPLRIDGEQRFVLEPLGLPQAGAEHDPEDARSTAAIALFVERARAIVPEFELTADNTLAVIEICRMLGGLPLAIELAAAQTRLLAPRQLAERLEGRLTGLRGDRVDLPDRHRTMGAAIAWSHDLLAPESQTLFRWLSAFPGGFSLDAAEAVGQAARMADVDSALLGLVEHSLVQRREITPHRYRFGMLEVVREFGLDRLNRHGEEHRAQEAIARYALQLTRQARVGLTGEMQAEWLDLLEDERNNLTAVLAWLQEHDRAHEAAELAANTIVFRVIHGHDHADLPALEKLLGHPDLESNDKARGLALLAAGVARNTAIGYPEGLATLAPAIDTFRRFELNEWLADALKFSAHPLFVMGEHDRGRAAAEECLRIGETLGSLDAQIMGLLELSVYAWIMNDLEENRRLLQQVRQLAASHGPPNLLSRTLFMEGTRALGLGDNDTAEACHRASIELDEMLGALPRVPANLQALGRIAHLRGDPDTARACYTRAVEVATNLGNIDLANEVRIIIGELEREQNRFGEAIKVLQRAVSRRKAKSSPHTISAVLDQLADVALAAGDLPSAARFTGAADAVFEDLGLQRWSGLSTERRREREAGLRKALGDTAFTEAHAAGKMLTADTAVEEMLAWEPDKQPAEPQPPPELPEGLSPREMEVLRLMADGLTNQEIADTLFVSHRTAAAHSSNIIGKLGVSSRTGAVAHAIRSGLA